VLIPAYLPPDKTILKMFQFSNREDSQFWTIDLGSFHPELLGPSESTRTSYLRSQEVDGFLREQLQRSSRFEHWMVEARTQDVLGYQFAIFLLNFHRGSRYSYIPVCQRLLPHENRSVAGSQAVRTNMANL